MVLSAYSHADSFRHNENAATKAGAVLGGRGAKDARSAEEPTLSPTLCQIARLSAADRATLPVRNKLRRHSAEKYKGADN